MSEGTESAPTEFELSPTIRFEASDVAQDLPPADVVELIKELDLEIDCWEATILLAAYFSEQLKHAPPELVAMNDEALEKRLEEMEDAK